MDRFSPQLSARALSTPEPLVRAFARRVQQEGALDLTQGDYKNADFAPHPEVVRAAQRITRNTVHSYGPAVGRMDVRSEIAEFFNRDGRIDYPSTDVRFLPDEVIFTSGTRSGLAMVLEVLGADGTGVVVPEAELGVRLVRGARRQAPRRAARRRPRSSCRTRPSSIGCSRRAGSRRSSSTTRTIRRAASTRAASSKPWWTSRCVTAPTCSTTRSTSASTTSARSSIPPLRAPSGATGWSRCPACRRWTCSARRREPARAGW